MPDTLSAPILSPLASADHLIGREHTSAPSHFSSGCH